jgi:hypothetical protein
MANEEDDAMIRTFILLIFGGLLLWKAMRNLRRQKLKEKYALLFAGCALPFVTLAVWPDGIVAVSEFLEIEKPTLLVMSLSIFVLLMIFELLKIVSVQDRKITTLAQEAALLRDELKKVKAGKEEESSKDKGSGV